MTNCKDCPNHTDNKCCHESIRQNDRAWKREFKHKERMQKTLNDVKKMKMIDRASGEVGTLITHPLQARVDRIIDRRLERGETTIDLSSFSSIRNTNYVRNRLEKRGFHLDNGKVTRYVTEAQNRYRELFKKPVLERLQNEGVITNEGLNTKEKSKLSQTICYLKQGGTEIEITRAWSEKTNRNISVYKLKTP